MYRTVCEGPAAFLVGEQYSVTLLLMTDWEELLSWSLVISSESFSGPARS